MTIGKPIAQSLLGCAALCLSYASLADGMIPQTSVVIVDEALGEASITVSNSDPSAALLQVTLENVPEDSEALLFVTPPVSRVEAGQEQLVRFVLRNEQPLTTQRLKRVIFEGIAQSKGASTPGEITVGVNVRQNLPVILHPKGLAPNREPWVGLQWFLHGGQLSVVNSTPYVVRLAQDIRLLPSEYSVQLPRSYVLPGDRIDVAASDAPAGTREVRLAPATVYGFAVDAYDAPLRPEAP